jgi:hypothetical protein
LSQQAIAARGAAASSPDGAPSATDESARDRRLDK